MARSTLESLLKEKNQAMVSSMTDKDGRYTKESGLKICLMAKE